MSIKAILFALHPDNKACGQAYPGSVLYVHAFARAPNYMQKLMVAHAKVMPVGQLQKL